jgi:hypothetical protein
LAISAFREALSCRGFNCGKAGFKQFVHSRHVRREIHEFVFPKADEFSHYLRRKKKKRKKKR